jgi:hypothetical protein
MNARTQKFLGITLIAGAPIAAGVLYALSFRFFSADFEKLSSTGSSVWVGRVSFHWPSGVLIASVVLGLWFLMRSRHERPKA